MHVLCDTTCFYSTVRGAIKTKTDDVEITITITMLHERHLRVERFTAAPFNLCL